MIISHQGVSENQIMRNCGPFLDDDGGGGAKVGFLVTNGRFVVLNGGF